MVIFKTKDRKELEEISMECSGEVDPAVFHQVYQRATDEPHAFLFVDLHKKDHHPSMFRKNFDTFLIPQEITEGPEKMISEDK